MNSNSQTKISKKLITSQRQAFIKLTVKEDKDKRFIKSWRPISLLNIDYKIISKAFSVRLKNVLQLLISSQQTAYVANRCISESRRLISDLLDVTEKFKTKGYLVTIDIEKAFDSLDHSFLLTTLGKFGFGTDFIDWIEIFLNYQESCVINGGVTTQYFKLEKSARQGDPVSAYLFILFTIVKNNEDIKSLKILENTFLYTTLFLKKWVQ